MSTKNIILAVLVVAALGVGIWYALTMTEGQNPLSRDNKVVAKVNGEKITNTDFQAQLQQAEQLSSQQNLNIDKEQLKSRVLDQMIGNILIRQKAKDEDISVKEEEVDKKIDEIIKSLGGEEAFNKQLEDAELTQEGLEEMTREQLLTEKYIESQVPEKELEVSEEEVKNYFNQMMLQQGGKNATNTPKLEDMSEKEKEQIKTQLRQQKQTTKTQELIEELRQDADIEKKL